MRIFFSLICVVLAGSLFAQESSDPQAKEVLESLKKKMDAYESLSADFTLTLEYPEEEPEVQKGKVTVKGEQYKLEMESQSILCDGSSLWLHLKNRNEVQINNYDPDAQADDLMSPKDLFRIYEKEDFIYAITNEGMEGSIAILQIEFKPTDPNSEYSKLRLTINKKTKEIMRLKFFGKDGHRYTLSIDKFIPNKDLAVDFFTFKKSDFPNIRIEDLRL